MKSKYYWIEIESHVKHFTHVPHACVPHIVGLYQAIMHE